MVASAAIVLPCFRDAPWVLGRPAAAAAGGGARRRAGPLGRPPGVVSVRRGRRGSCSGPALTGRALEAAAFLHRRC